MKVSAYYVMLFTKRSECINICSILLMWNLVNLPKFQLEINKLKIRVFLGKLVFHDKLIIWLFIIYQQYILPKIIANVLTKHLFSVHLSKTFIKCFDKS